MAKLPQDVLEKSILVVDDMVSMRAIIVALLRSMGFSNIEQAENGEKAIKKLTRKSYDIVLSDWDMPGIDGLTLLKTVRDELKLSKVVFLLITANDSQHKVESARAAGVNDYIVKPITFQQVQERIERAWLNAKKR